MDEFTTVVSTFTDRHGDTWAQTETRREDWEFWTIYFPDNGGSQEMEKVGDKWYVRYMDDEWEEADFTFSDLEAYWPDLQVLFHCKCS